MSKEHFSFTTKWNCKSNVLYNEVEVFIPNTQTSLKILAIWDTGASSSAITQDIVDTLGLSATGVSSVNTAAGLALQNTFIVDVRLPNAVTVSGVTVTGIPSIAGANMLIGMDIIGLGDFSVTNFNNETCMSFRFPSIHEIDYARHPMHKWITPKHIPPGKPGSNRTPKKKKRR